jgi:hypothetical protein
MLQKLGWHVNKKIVAKKTTGTPKHIKSYNFIQLALKKTGKTLGAGPNRR